MPHDAEHCHACRTRRATSGSRCTRCAAAHRREEAVRREERRAKGLCVTCADRAAKGRRYCAKHLEYYAERARSG